jgi:hypothetical protein
LVHPAMSTTTEPMIALNTAFCPMTVNHPSWGGPNVATWLVQPTLGTPQRAAFSASLCPDPENVLRTWRESSQKVERCVRCAFAAGVNAFIRRSCPTIPSSLSFAPLSSYPERVCSAVRGAAAAHRFERGHLRVSGSPLSQSVGLAGCVFV